MAAPAASERRFEKLNHVVHERLPFSPFRICHIRTAFFEGRVYGRLDRQLVLAGFHEDVDKSRFDHILCDKRVDMYLALSVGRGQNNRYWITGTLRPASISNAVGKLCWFCDCANLSRAALGQSSSLKLIMEKATFGSGVRDIRIPDNVEALWNDCFSDCLNLSRVTFGQSSALRLIGYNAFCRSGVREIRIPDSVTVLDNKCFFKCKQLSRLTFCESSSLRLIGHHAFYCSGLREIHLPASVEELCWRCFCKCQKLSRVSFAERSSLMSIEVEAFYRSGLTSVCLPESVRFIGQSAFSRCPLNDFVICETNSFLDVVLGLLVSKDHRICYGWVSELEEVVIPDSVEELCDECFWECERVSQVMFGESSKLKLIGKRAFCRTGITEVYIPDGVEELCEECFCECKSLLHVAFGKSSSLKLIGRRAFFASGVTDIHFPDGVVVVSDDAAPGYKWIRKPWSYRE